MEVIGPGAKQNTRKKEWAWVLLVLGLFVLGGLSIRAQSADNVAYPSGYRRWTLVKTVLIGTQSPAFKDSGGIHHIYANEKSMEGYATGKFPDGAIFVFDLLEAKEKDGVTGEGSRKRIDVMVKDSKRYAASGGWGFERFLGDTRTAALNEENRKICVTCHEQRKEHGMVFSEYRE